MKRLFIIFMMAVAVMSASAQGFRGFIDLYGGISPSKGVDYGKYGDYLINDIRPIVAFGMNVTEGYQINKMFFAGIGFGGYTVIDHYKVEYRSGEYGWSEGETHFPAIMCPVYADVRWTLDITRTVTPFVDLKIGYQFRVSLSDGSISWWEGRGPFLRQSSGLYLQPTVGFRFGRSSAFNLGIAYNATISQKLYAGPSSLGEKLKGGALMLSLGADF